MMTYNISRKSICQLLSNKQNGIYRQCQFCYVTKSSTNRTIKFKSCQTMNNHQTLLPHYGKLQTNCFASGISLGNPGNVNLSSLRFYSKTRSHTQCPNILSSSVFAQNNREYASDSKGSSKKEQYYDKSKSSRTKLYYTLKQYIRSPENAETFVSHLKENERRLLLTALETSIGTNANAEQGEEAGKITRRQLYLVFVHNCVPFIGFGFLDNAIMILAGEYIDLTIGVTFGISTMAAAALGNIISDLAGIGLAGYVEMLFYKLGLPVPALTPEQAEQRSTMFSSNAGKAFGILVGCLIGMFPLFFIDKEEKKE